MKTDVLITGIGSAGFAAAYRFLTTWPGGSAVLVDPNPAPGGTSVFGGVCCWEPGRSGNGVHRKLAENLLSAGDGFVGKTTEFVSQENRWAVSSRCSDPYEATLMRYGLQPEEFRRFHFRPESMSRGMRNLLEQAAEGHECRAFFRSRAVSLEKRGSFIRRVRVQTPEGELLVEPKIVIDCTGGAILAAMAGEQLAAGEEPIGSYGEPSAPALASARMNGITLCFRIVPDSGNAEGEPHFLARTPDLDLWEEQMERTDGPVACWNECPGGGFVVNMLPTAPGELLLGTNPDRLRQICEARVFRYWEWLQNRCPSARRYRIDSLFPMLGIRENRRLVGRYVLREQDLTNGFPACGEDRIIAVADHPADIHGSGSRLSATGVYGIPYDCLLPRNTENLLVAGMSASFSHIAASSARLSRTMLELGEAAGTAAALCIRDGLQPGDVLPAELRSILCAETMPDEIRQSCRAE